MKKIFKIYKESPDLIMIYYVAGFLSDSDIEKLGNDVTLEDETLEDILAASPNIEHLISEQN